MENPNPKSNPDSYRDRNPKLNQIIKLTYFQIKILIPKSQFRNPK
jgi:hypothetical protein